MTDFFADLEQELRGAHPRRPKPVVPVRAIAVAAAALSAVIVALGTLAPGDEKEVAQQPPVQEGWTAYAPLDTPRCDQGHEPHTVGDRVPDALSEAFAVLRSGDAPPDPVEADLPDVREIYGRGVRVIHIDTSTGPLAILPVRLGCPGDPGELGMCLVRLVDESPQRHACAAIGAEKDFIVSVVDPVRDGVARVGVLASDSAFDRVEVRGGEGRESRSPKWNLVVAERRVEASRDVEIGLGAEAQDAVTVPLNCAGRPELRSLKDRLAIFREPPAEDVAPFEAALPAGYHRAFLEQARVVEFGENVRYVVFPAGDATCGTAVCLVREGNEQVACGAVRSGVVTQLVTDLGGGEYAVGSIVSDGVDSVTVRSPDGATTDELTAPAPRTSVFYSRIETDRPQEIEVVPGS